MRAKRVDSNQDAIVKALRAVGCSVQSLAMVGQGVPDLLVSRCGINYLMEIKNEDQPKSGQELTIEELRWHLEWKGQLAIVRNVKEALAVIGGQMQ